MTFQQLQYLLEVSKANSISKAAANLYIATSSVSASVNSLEDELGFPIFVRNQKGLVPTQKGLTVLEHAKRICRTYDEMTKLKDAPDRHLRLCGSGFAPVCKAYARVVQEYGTKDIHFHLSSHSQDGALQNLCDGRLDLVVLSQYTPGLRKLEMKVEKLGLKCERLTQVPYCACVRRDHRFAGQAAVTLEELEKETMIDSAGYVYSTGFFDRLMCLDQDKILAAGTDSARLELVRAGVGYSLQMMPPASASDVEGVVYVPVEGVTAEIVVVTDPNVPENELVLRYISYLKQEFRKA